MVEGKIWDCLMCGEEHSFRLVGGRFLNGSGGYKLHGICFLFCKFNHLHGPQLAVSLKK